MSSANVYMLVNRFKSRHMERKLLTMSWDQHGPVNCVFLEDQGTINSIHYRKM